MREAVRGAPLRAERDPETGERAYFIGEEQVSREAFTAERDRRAGQTTEQASRHPGGYAGLVDKKRRERIRQGDPNALAPARREARVSAPRPRAPRRAGHRRVRRAGRGQRATRGPDSSGNPDPDPEPELDHPGPPRAGFRVSGGVR